MANVKVMSQPMLLRVFYDVDAAVGTGCPNRREDVYLVQFLISVIWGKKDMHGDVVGAAGKPAPRVDGICGPETITAIRQFQEYYGVTLVDGRVDPVPPGQSYGPIHKMAYTMIGLNTNVAGLLSTDRHALICNEPNFPMLLKQKLFK
jgi:peptidoglycan hydrolase-like protein with peptidoglycan-binding domain